MFHLLTRLFLPVIVLFAITAILLPKFTTPIQIGCCPVDPSKPLTAQYDPSVASGEFHKKIVTVPPIYIPQQVTQVLGDATNKHIEVDLANQRVYAYEGGTRIFNFLVSTGLWGRTPTGTFTIQRKITAQLMKGGDPAKGTYYYLPNVPWVMFFGNNQIPWYRGFSFHGTYWHNNFGQPMSHGCINMKTPEAKQLFDWAPMGTEVRIY